MSTFPALIGGDATHLALLDGCQLVLFNASGDIVGATELPEAPAAVHFADGMLCVIHTDAAEAVITSYDVTELAPVSTAIIDGNWTPTGVTNGRLILLDRDRLNVTVVKVAKRAMTASSMRLGLPTEIALPLDRPTILVTKQLAFEIWDVVGLRPASRMGFTIPPAPRTMCAAQGHAVVIHGDSDALTIFRLSDGRPYRQSVGSRIVECIAHIGSPYLVLRTETSLLRLHCYSHSLMDISAPPAHAYALLPNGDDTHLAGWALGDDAPWRASLKGPIVEGGLARPLVGGAATEFTPPRVAHAGPNTERISADRAAGPGINSGLSGPLVGGAATEFTPPRVAHAGPNTERISADRAAGPGINSGLSGPLVVGAATEFTPPRVAHAGPNTERTSERLAAEPVETTRAPSAEATDAANAQLSVVTSSKAVATTTPGSPRESVAMQPPLMVASSTATASSWRQQLVNLHKTTAPPVASYQAALPDSSTMMSWLVREQCGPACQTMLSILYARYLCGQDGIPISQLAGMLSDLTDAETAWKEALGNGQCGDHGVVSYQQGNVSIEPVAARYFDDAITTSQNRATDRPPISLAGVYLFLTERDQQTVDQRLRKQFGATQWLAHYTAHDLLQHHLCGTTTVTTSFEPALQRCPRFHRCVVVSTMEPAMQWRQLPRITFEE